MLCASALQCSHHYVGSIGKVVHAWLDASIRELSLCLVYLLDIEVVCCVPVLENKSRDSLSTVDIDGVCLTGRDLRFLIVSYGGNLALTLSCLAAQQRFFAPVTIFGIWGCAWSCLALPRLAK